MLCNESGTPKINKTNQQLSIGFPLATDMINNKIQALCDAINLTYCSATPTLWKVPQKRIDVALLKYLLEENKILLAKINDDIAGCIKITQEYNYIEFGLLFTDPRYQRIGVATALIQKTEEIAADRLVEFVQLKLVMPITRKDPHQEFLKTWYEKLGYAFHSKEACSNDELNSLTTACEFIVYRKPVPCLAARPFSCTTLGK